MLRLDDHRVGLVNFHFNRRRIEPADRLVREMQIAYVFRGHLERGINRFIRNLYRIVSFQTRPQTKQNLSGLED